VVAGFSRASNVKTMLNHNPRLVKSVMTGTRRDSSKIAWLRGISPDRSIVVGLARALHDSDL
jgi:hypothetical protein